MPYLILIINESNVNIYNYRFLDESPRWLFSNVRYYLHIFLFNSPVNYYSHTLYFSKVKSQILFSFQLNFLFERNKRVKIQYHYTLSTDFFFVKKQ